MFESYSYAARRIVFWALGEARRLRGREIAPEHLLLGILIVDASLVSRFLSPDIAAGSIRQAVESHFGGNPAFNPIGMSESEFIEALAQAGVPASQEMRLNTEAEQVLHLSLQLAPEGKLVTPHHVLLALLQLGETAAARILSEAGLHMEEVREAFNNPDELSQDNRPEPHG
jgi:ATP-dependent Clp protease ATP-binding subunit ClpA